MQSATIPVLLGQPELVDVSEYPPVYRAPVSVLLALSTGELIPVCSAVLLVNAQDSGDWSLVDCEGSAVSVSVIADIADMAARRQGFPHVRADTLLAQFDDLTKTVAATAKVLPTATHTAPEALQ